VNEINSFPFLQTPLYYPFISNNLNFPDQSCNILPAISLLQRLRKSDKFHFLIAISSRNRLYQTMLAENRDDGETRKLPAVYIKR
jgi:hypothetical protein